MAIETITGAKAINLGTTPSSFRDRVSATNASDFYRLRLQRSSFTLSLKGLGANADVELIQDRNRNGQIDLGDVVASSRAGDRQPDSIAINGLSSGTYFVRVLAKAGADTRYRLTLAAKPTSKISNAYAIVQQTNAFRLANGLPPLAVNTQLTIAAQKYAQSLAIDDNWSHTGTDGSSPWDRITAAGYNFSEAAENLAAGHTTAASAIKGWINSPGHRRNLLAYQVQEIGVGYYYYPQDAGKVTFKHYWAQDLGTPSDVRVVPNVPDGGNR